jgi:hypothetical protein
VRVGPDVRRGVAKGTYTHYSILATIEDSFRLSRLANARGAPSLAPLFKRAPRPARRPG